MLARYYFDLLRTSYWFVPSLMTLLAVGAALGAVRLDEVADWERYQGSRWIYMGSGEGARQLLATVAGSMITVAGVVFSITIVALTQASSQFGPRLLRNFIRDRGNQVVLGTFIATFVYSMMVLRTVRGEDSGDFVPHVAVTVSVLLALASVAVLIYFIHHASVSMQAPTIVANVGNEVVASIDQLFPEKIGSHRDARHSELEERFAADGFGKDGYRICANDDGYVQVIEYEDVIRRAKENSLQLRFMVRPGHFVVRGSLLCLSKTGISEDDAKHIRDSVVLDGQQTAAQDLEFVVNQLVEIAVRALSPGINDPFTAVNCVDHLTRGLCRLAERKVSGLHRDEPGKFRVIIYPLRFSDVLDTAFRQIRQYGRKSAAVLIRMLDSIPAIMEHVHRPEDLSALHHHAKLIYQAAAELPQEADQRDVRERYDRVIKTEQERRLAIEFLDRRGQAPSAPTK